MDFIHIIEYIAATIGILYVVLELRASIWLWPVGIILPLFYIYISWGSHLYGNIIVNIYYLFACIWGWWMWLKHKDDVEARIRRVPIRVALLVSGIALIAWIVIAYLFGRFTNNAAPVWDGLATSISIIGMWLLGKKYIDNWYCWIVSNAIYCVLFYIQGYHVTAGFFTIYTVLAVWGLIHWHRLMKTSHLV